MRSKMLFLGCLVVLAIALVPVVFAAAPASAATAVSCNVFVPGSCPPRPASTDFGVPLSDLDTAAPLLPPAGGGWWTSTTSDSSISWPGGVAAYPMQTSIVKLTDPYTLSGKLAMSAWWWNLRANANTGVALTTWTQRTSSLTKSRVTCAPTQYSLAGAQTVLAFNSSGITIKGGSSAAGGSGQVQFGSAANHMYTPVATACPFLVKINLTIEFAYQCSSTLVNQISSGTIAGSTCPAAVERTYEWNAADWSNQTPYRHNSRTPELEACLNTPYGQASPECPYIDGFSEHNNSTRADEKCDNGPQPAWLDYSWLIPMISHWTRCLFVPSLSADSMLDEVHVALDTSHIATTIDMVAEIPEAFAWSESCGVVVDSPAPVPIRIDTCDMGEFTQYKEMIRVGIMLLASLAAIWSIIDTTTTTIKLGKFDRLDK